MTIYKAILRGIKVGGKNIIEMAELKQIFVATISLNCSQFNIYS